MKYSMFNSRSNEFIRKCKINKKEEYALAIYTIEDTYTGRTDVQFANSFIYESTKLIINSIKLFEQGYFDNAYYSLREAIEVSTTMIFFSDLPNEERQNKRKEWSNLEKFPMQNQMILYLEKNGLEFCDIKNKLNFFFEDIKTISSKINKIVHKQSFRYFYTIRNNYIYHDKFDIKEFINEYIFYLEKTIGIVAIMRLVVDPMPIILNDYEIYSRTNDMITRQYPGDFIKKYIGQKTIEKYKETALYQNHYKVFMKNEQMNESTLNIVKNHYVDTSKKKDIEKQYHLMEDWELYSSILILNINKVCKVYICDGIQTYFSNRESNRKKLGFSSRDFTNFSKNKDKFNQKYDEAYISVINIRNENYFLEHNEKFTKEEINELKKIN